MLSDVLRSILEVFSSLSSHWIRGSHIIKQLLHQGPFTDIGGFMFLDVLEQLFQFVLSLLSRRVDVVNAGPH
jgi:hypothetical protein